VCVCVCVCECVTPATRHRSRPSLKAVCTVSPAYVVSSLGGHLAATLFLRRWSHAGVGT